MQGTTCRMMGLRDLVLCCPLLTLTGTTHQVRYWGLAGAELGQGEYSSLPFKPDVFVGSYILLNPSLLRLQMQQSSLFYSSC